MSEATENVQRPTSNAQPPTPKRLITPEYIFDHEEAARCEEEWGMNCGPAALATMLSLHPDQVRAHIPDFDEKRYTSPTMMKAALNSLKVRFREEWEDAFVVNVPNGQDDRRFQRFPTYGLARIQFEGPWMKPGVPIPARYRYTHWVGSMLCTVESTPYLIIFDVNCGWMNYPGWRDTVMPTLAATYKRADGGWHVTHRWQLVFETP